MAPVCNDAPQLCLRPILSELDPLGSGGHVKGHGYLTIEQSGLHIVPRAIFVPALDRLSEDMSQRIKAS